MESVKMDNSSSPFPAHCLCNGKCGKCPVCHFGQYPDLMKCSTCMECQDTEALWFCLTCGHVGCSRHKQGHALAHHNNTKHSCVMDLKNFKIWDYDKFSYVDNLKASPQPNANAVADCKCPVCRYHQTPKLSKVTTCMSCDSSTNLWLCLNCSHIGCGRHEQRHALHHYNRSQHKHAMHLDSFCIWDYREDKYVHRLYSESLIAAMDVVIKTEDEEEEEESFEQRIKRLENEWKNFSKLKETNRQMISIEQRLITLSEDKKLLEGKLREHDSKLSELLNQFKGNQSEMIPTADSDEPNDTDSMKSQQATSGSKVSTRPNGNKPIITISVSENLEQTQLIIFFILLLFLYHFFHLFVQAITGNS